MDGTCQVMRCMHSTVTVIDIAEGREGWGRVEAGVCADHHDRINAGEPYAIEDGGLDGEAATSSYVIVMGPDLVAKNLLVVTKVSMTSGFANYARGLGDYQQLTIEVDHHGTDRKDMIKLTLTPTSVEMLRTILDAYPSA